MSSRDWRHVRTARLWLDPPVPEDVPDLVAVHAATADWAAFPAARLADRMAAEELVTRSRQHWAERGLGYWCVRDTEGGPVVGRAGCAVPGDLPWWNLHYRLAPGVRRRGYAAEACRAAVEAARDVDPERPVLAYLLATNHASRRTAERLGLAVVWRGPDRGDPWGGTEGLAYADRAPAPDVLAVIEREHAVGAS